MYQSFFEKEEIIFKDLKESKLVNQNYTYREIMTKVQNWEKVYSDVVDGKVSLDLNIFSDNYDEIIFKFLLLV